MKLRPFELALVIGFGTLALAALTILAIYEEPDDVDTSTTQVVGQVTLWGTLPSDVVVPVIDLVSENNESFNNVVYRYVSPESFDNRLLNALADNQGPDALLVSHERLAQLQRRLQPISYDSIPWPDFQNLYLDGAGIYAFSDGIYALPVAVDPLLMYWNRDILFNAQVLTPPQTWEELINDVFPVLIERDVDRTINRSVVAFGESVNVRNAHGVVSALLAQADSRFVTVDGGRYNVRLSDAVGAGGNPLTSVLRFYTSFSEPTNALYSWNRSLSDDRTQFLRENLALYFGFMSEGQRLAVLNPNLNFDVAEIPQSAGSTLRRTYGKYYGFSVLRVSPNQQSALNVIFELAATDNVQRLAANANMVPVYRSQVARGSDSLFGRAGYQAAPVAYGWRNPNIEATNRLLEGVIEDIGTNRQSVSGAARDYESRLELAF